MTVCYLLPSANEAKARVHLPRWIAKGYRVITLQDRFRFEVPGVETHHQAGQYPGYPKSIWRLIHTYLPADCDLVVIGGDDMDPDPVLDPATIRGQFYERFPDGYGVMQPTGDRWMIDGSGRAASERICGSPFLGRAFLFESYGGDGPLCQDYFHFYADEDLFNYATRQGVLWQRRDMTHHHDHWSRDNKPNRLIYDVLQQHWNTDKAIFEMRQSLGFPGERVRRKG